MIEMEMELETGMGPEVQFKRDHNVEAEVEDEAVKKRKVELDPEEMKPLVEAEGITNFNRWLHEIEDEEQLTDHYAFQAKKFRKFWDSLYHNPNGPYGYFEDESEFLIAPYLLCSDCLLNLLPTHRWHQIMFNWVWLC